MKTTPTKQEERKLKVYCGKCGEEMSDKVTYIICNSEKCDTSTTTHSIPANLASLVKYQLAGVIILK